MILHSNPKLLAIHKKLLDFVENDVKNTTHHTAPGFRDTCYVLFAKSTKAFRAIQHLCNNGIGYGEDAIILTRSLLENLITLAYISNPQSTDERERRAKLFINWIIIDGNRLKDRLKDGDPVKAQLEQNLKIMDPNGEIYKKAKRLFQEQCCNICKSGRRQNKWSWSGLSIKDMAEEVGLLEPYYNKVYWLYSQIVHPHPGGSSSYMKPNPSGEGVIICDTPNSGWIEEALFSSFDCYRQILRVINNISNPSLNNRLAEIEKEYEDLVRELIRS